MGDIFDQGLAASYESWYETEEGGRAAALEKCALQRLLESFRRADLEPGEVAPSILEVGCGTGYFTRWLRDTGWTTCGLDLSAPMLSVAQTLDRVPLVRGDAYRLPFADGAFDVTALITTLGFLDRPDEALAEAVRVARQGIVLGVKNRWSILGVQRRLRGLFRSTIYDSARLFFGVRQLKRLLRAATEDDARVAWRTTLFPAWIRRLLPWCRQHEHLPGAGFIAIVVHEAR